MLCSIKKIVPRCSIIPLSLFLAHDMTNPAPPLKILHTLLQNSASAASISPSALHNHPFHLATSPSLTPSLSLILRTTTSTASFAAVFVSVSILSVVTALCHHVLNNIMTALLPASSALQELVLLSAKADSLVPSIRNDQPTSLAAHVEYTSAVTSRLVRFSAAAGTRGAKDAWNHEA